MHGPHPDVLCTGGGKGEEHSKSRSLAEVLVQRGESSSGWIISKWSWITYIYIGVE